MSGPQMGISGPGSFIIGKTIYLCRRKKVLFVQKTVLADIIRTYLEWKSSREEGKSEVECPYYIYDNEEEKFLPVTFSMFEMTERHIEKELESNYERYIIFEKLTSITHD